MNTYITPEFIEESKKIQDELIPDKGMWAILNYYDDPEFPDIHPDIIRWVAPEDNNSIKTSYSDAFIPRSSYLVFPTLGWLVRRLAEITYEVEVVRRGEAWFIHYHANRYSGGRNVPHENTPELACLRALIRIKEGV